MYIKYTYACYVNHIRIDIYDSDQLLPAIKDIEAAV